MYGLIKNYMNSLRMDTVKEFALKNNISLNDNELVFTYNYLKKNWETILKNPNSFNLDAYKNEFSEENFPKIKALFNEYYQKYHHFL